MAGRPPTREEPSVVVATRLEPDTAKKLREAAELEASTASEVLRRMAEERFDDKR